MNEIMFSNILLTIIVIVSTYLILKFTIYNIVNTHNKEKQKFLDKEKEIEQNEKDKLEFLWFAISNIIIERKMYNLKRNNIKHIDVILNEIYKLEASELLNIYKKNNIKLTEFDLVYFIGNLTFERISDLEFLIKKILLVQPERRREFTNLIRKERIKGVFIKKEISKP
jgi:hypothetical protein